MIKRASFFFLKCLFKLLIKLNSNVILNEKQVLVCISIYKYIPYFFHITFLDLFFQIILHGNNFVKIKILTLKHQKLNSKLNAPHFVSCVTCIFYNIGTKSAHKGNNIMWLHPKGKKNEYEKGTSLSLVFLFVAKFHNLTKLFSKNEF
jgi:hypothetical protein